MLIVSMLLFSRLVQRLSDLQITNVLHLTGDKGRNVIRDMSGRLDRRHPATLEPEKRAAAGAPLGPVTQALRYFGEPRTIARLEIPALVHQAQRAGEVIVMKCAVGDTLVEGTLLLQISAPQFGFPNKCYAAFHLDRERTSSRTPNTRSGSW